MSVAPSTQREMLNTLQEWSLEEQLQFLEQALYTIRQRGVTAPKQRRPTLEDALKVSSGTRPAPSDEEVAQWLDEHRMEKYGR